MEIRHLRYFIAVAELKNLSKAARQLHIVQPALSKNIKDLENNIGIQLFTRTSSGMELTLSGKIFLDHAYGILRKIEIAKRSVQSKGRETVGEVSLGMTGSLADVLTIPIYKGTKSRYPNIRLSFMDGVTSLLHNEFDADKLDLIIEMENINISNYAYENLFEEKLYLVGLAKGTDEDWGEISLENAKEYLEYIPSSNNNLPALFDQYVQECRKNEVTSYQVDYHSSRRLMNTGIGHTILPWSAVYKEVLEGRLAIREVVEPRLTRTISLLSPLTKPYTNAMVKVSDLVKEIVKELYNEGIIRGKLLIE